MERIWGQMADINGKFRTQFQSEAFYSRLFELACFCYLSSHKGQVCNTYEAPDFLIETPTGPVAIEATTLNPTGNRYADISLNSIPDASREELIQKSMNDLPIRMSRSLKKKLKKEYWKLPHCKGVPLVIMICPLHEAASVYHPDHFVVRFLYGQEYQKQLVCQNGIWRNTNKISEHSYMGRTAKSNFFNQKGTESISAVIYANSFTIPKFFRHAIQDEQEPKSWFARYGAGYRNINGENVEITFTHEYPAPMFIHENWWDGVTVCHNPNAAVPLKKAQLACSSEFTLENGRPKRTVYGFHPQVSYTEFFDAYSAAPRTFDINKFTEDLRAFNPMGF